MAMWEAFYKRWLDLLFWWVPRKQQAPPRTTTDAPSRKPQEGRSNAAGAKARAAPDRSAAPARPATQKAAPKPSRPSAQPAPGPAAAQPEKTVAPPVPDDLTVIKGIGPAVQNKLRALGITTFADLAAADPDRLLAQLKGSQPLTLGRVRHWTEAARQRVRT
jgi:predicted flap endonuclease-1-like 5' DNA nuclease